MTQAYYATFLGLLACYDVIIFFIVSR